MVDKMTLELDFLQELQYFLTDFRRGFTRQVAVMVMPWTAFI
jgi:hypothetical protein